MELELNVRGDLILVDLVVRVLEFIKQVENVSVMSVNAGTQRTLETEALTNRVVLRLKIQVFFYVACRSLVNGNNDISYANRILKGIY